MAKTRITEAAITTFALNMLMAVLPFFDVVMTTAQMQGISVVMGMIGIAIWRFRKKQKKGESDNNSD